MMKKIDHNLLAIATFFLLCSVSLQAQDQMYWVHIDHVKPAMQTEYEKVAKEFADACKTNAIPDAYYSTWRHNNGDYVYASPIKNYAELDVNNMKPLMDKLGKEKFQSIFERFDKCYDSHSSFISTFMKEMSYMPNDKLNDGDFRKYHFFYVTPSNSKAMKQKLKEIKDLFAAKNSKEYYVIHHSGFGAPEEYYLAILGAKSELDYEQTSAENNKMLGEEWQKKWSELYALMSRYEVRTAMFRPDLSYTAKK